MLANLSPATAQALYGVIVALIAVLVAVGFIGADQVEVWTNLAAAVLGLVGSGVAVARVSAQRRDGTLS